MQLAKYDAMINAINVCEGTDEVKDLLDQATAMEHYFKQKNNFDAEDKAARIRVRAARKWKQLYNNLGKNKGGGDQKSKNHRSQKRTGDKTLTEQGVTKKQSSEYERLAEMDDDEFETALKSTTSKPTVKSVGASSKKQAAKVAAKPKARKKVMSDDALALWQMLLDFEKSDLKIKNQSTVVAEYVPSMMADVKRVLPGLLNYFHKLEKRIK